MMLILTSAFFWFYPTVSAVQLAGAEPAAITILGCGSEPGNTDTKNGCTGEWTISPGETGHGLVSYSNSGNHRASEVVDGYLIGGKGRLSTDGWIVDMAVSYPIAIVATFFAVRSARRWNQRRNGRLYQQPLGLAGI